MTITCFLLVHFAAMQMLATGLSTLTATGSINFTAPDWLKYETKEFSIQYPKNFTLD